MLADAKDLKNVLGVVKKVSTSQGFGPQAGTVRFQDGEIQAHSGGVSVGVPHEHDLDCILPISVISPVVKKLKGELEIDQKTSTSIRLKAGAHESAIQTMEMEDWTMIEREDLEEVPLPDGVIDGFQVCLGCVNKNETRPQFSGVSVDGNMIFASDGLRIGRYRLDSPLPLEGVILPRAFVDMATGLGLPNKAAVSERFFGLWFPVEGRPEEDSIFLGCAFIDVTFPAEWLQFFPEEEPEFVQIEMTADVTAGLKRMELYESTDTFFPGVSFVVESDRLVCSYKGHRASSQEDIPFQPEYKGEPFSFRTYPSFLHWALKNCDGRFALRKSPDLVYCSHPERPVQLLVSVMT